MQLGHARKSIGWGIVVAAVGSVLVTSASAAPTAQQTESLHSGARALTKAESLYKTGKLAPAATAFEAAQKSLAGLADVTDLARQLDPLVKRMVKLHDSLDLDGAKVPALAPELAQLAAASAGGPAKLHGKLAARRGEASAKYSGAAPPYTGEWTVISEGILAELGKTHPVSNDTFARMTAGVTVDRTNGDVYLMANNIGICKSTDQGQSFALVSGKTVTGRFEYAAGLDMDPEGGRLMCFSIYGSSGYTGDGGKTWMQSKQSHLDFGAVDWSDTGKALLAIGHESGGKLMFSQDAGASWKTLGSGYWGAGMFDHNTLVSSSKQEGLVRSTDGGEKWTKVSDEKLSAAVMVDFKGIGYWLVDGGLLESKDKGATWAIAAQTPKGACVGTLFGADASQMVVGSPDGLYQSNDSGKTWALAVPLAPDMKIRKGGQWANYAWDPINNIFYASQMSKPAYKFVAKAAK